MTIKARKLCLLMEGDVQVIENYDYHVAVAKTESAKNSQKGCTLLPHKNVNKKHSKFKGKKKYFILWHLPCLTYSCSPPHISTHFIIDYSSPFLPCSSVYNIFSFSFLFTFFTCMFNCLHFVFLVGAHIRWMCKYYSEANHRQSFVCLS